jgi:prepilin peptidase CpaA
MFLTETIMLIPKTELIYPAASLFCAIVGAVYDVRSRKIPNFITLPSLLFGMILHFTVGGWKQLASATAAAMICGLVFLIFYLSGGMGAGDVKLIAAVGCVAGLSLVGPLLLWTSIVGGAMAIALALYQRKLTETMHNMLTLAIHHQGEGLTPHPEFNVQNPRSLRLPYALAIAAGSALSLCFVIGQR